MIGHGLWHRRVWGWWLAVGTIGPTGIVVVAHLLAALPAPNGSGRFLLISLLAALPVSALILEFLLSPRTRALFTDPDLAEPAKPQRRPWWLLSAQWLGALLVVILAAGLVLLYSLGPMVEAAWLTANQVLPAS